jgi:hypothetical protein
MPSSPLKSSEELEVNALLSTHGFPPSTCFPDPETIREIMGRTKEPNGDGASLAAELAATCEDEDFRNSALALSDALLPLGIIVNFPRIIWGKIPTIVSMAGSAHESKSARANLGQFLTLETLDPMMRAFKVCHAKRIPRIADVSHYIEAATFALYDARCLDAANNLIVSVERLRLSHLGWRLGGQEVAAHELRTAIASLESVAADALLRSRFRLYRRLLLLYLSEQFQTRSKVAATSGLYGRTLLNRAFVLHTNEPGSYYDLQDLISLFGFFDLYGEMLSHQYDVEVVGLLPDHDPEVNSRRAIFWATLIEDFVSAGRRRRNEESNLREHAKYAPPAESNLFVLEANEQARNRMLGHAMLFIGKEKMLSIIIRASVDLEATKETRDRLDLVRKLFEGLIRLETFDLAQRLPGSNP